MPLSLIEQQQIITKCSQDPFYFGKIVAPQYFPKEFASFHKCMLDEINNLPKYTRMVVIEVPRGYAKTKIVSTLNPLHRMIFSKGAQKKIKYIVVASFSQPKAEQIIDDYKKIIEGRNFQGIFPGTEFIKRRDDLIEVENKIMGFRFMIMGRGRDSQVTGLCYEEQRPQIFVGDDLENPDESYNQSIVDKNEAFVNGVVQFGLDSDMGFSILIGTPFAFDCTTQRFSRYPKGVKTIRFPGLVSDTVDMKAEEMSKMLDIPIGHSIWEDKFPTVDVERQRDDAIANGTIEHFMRHIMLDPRSEGSVRIPMEKIKYIEKESIEELKKMKLNVYILADYAYSKNIWSDESAYVVIGIDDEFNHYLIDSDAGKWGDVGTTDKVMEKVIEYKSQLKIVGVETKGIGWIEDRINKLKREHGLSFYLQELKTKNVSKPERIKATISLFEDGLIIMVRGQKKFEGQMSRFRGEAMNHGDDIIDAFAHIRDEGIAHKPVTPKTEEEELKEKTHKFFEQWSKNYPDYIKNKDKNMSSRRVIHAAAMRPNYF